MGMGWSDIVSQLGPHGLEMIQKAIGGGGSTLESLWAGGVNPFQSVPWWQRLAGMGAGVGPAGMATGGAVAGGAVAAGSNQIAQQQGVPWTPNMAMTGAGPAGMTMGWGNAMAQQRGRQMAPQVLPQGMPQGPSVWDTMRSTGASAMGLPPFAPNFMNLARGGNQMEQYRSPAGRAGAEPADYADEMAALDTEIEQATNILDEILGGTEEKPMSATKRRRRNVRNMNQNQTKRERRAWEEGEGSFR